VRYIRLDETIITNNNDQLDNNQVNNDQLTAQNSNKTITIIKILMK